MSLTIEMHNPAEKIFEELADAAITQSSVALTYAFIMAQEPNADWPRINRAIMARWKGKTALTRIKEAAWKQIYDWQSRAIQSGQGAPK